MIRSAQSRFPVVSKSHSGMSGKNNEDRFGVTAFLLNKRNPTPVLLAVLSDGVGGHKAGEVAAGLAVSLITETVSESSVVNPVQSIQLGIHRASQAIFAEAQKDTGKQGMAATVAVAWMIGHRLYTASVGDSRIYLLRGDKIRQISTDHTWIQEALDNNVLTPDQVEGHPNRHVIRRYLGGATPPEVDFRMRLDEAEDDQQSVNNQGTILQAGDRLLLSSDGLTDLVKDDEILAAFAQNDAETAVDTLIDLANQRGGHDNITIISFEIPSGINVVADKQPTIPVGFWVTAIIVGLLASLIFGYFWLQRNAFDWSRFFSATQESPQVTLNPVITSAPQITATTGRINYPQLVVTETPRILLPKPSQTP